MRTFVESRGYTVVTNYNQYIYPYGSNTKGFTFANFKSEIDAGRPVFIHVTGHTMLGYGYNDTGSTIYIHDTWDYSDHSMPWGGSYSGMAHYAVSVIQISGGSTTTTTTSTISTTTTTTTSTTSTTTTLPANLPNLRYWNAPNGSFKVSPQTGLNWGDNITTYYGFANIGTAGIPVGTRLRWRFYLSPDSNISTSDYYFKGYYSDSGLQSGFGRYGDFTEALPSSPPSGFPDTGTVYIGMIVDPLNEIAESDKTDNSNQGDGKDYNHITLSAACPPCPANGVITNVTYRAGTICSCSNATSITLGSNVTIESGATVTFTAPKSNIQPGFHAENGSTVNIKQ